MSSFLELLLMALYIFNKKIVLYKARLKIIIWKSWQITIRSSSNNDYGIIHNTWRMLQ